MLRNPERAQNLVNFVREEIERFRNGEIDSISTNDQLIERFGYQRRSSIYPTLNKVGLIKERRFLLEVSILERLKPSSELAWLLGVLAGKGNVGTDDGEISLASKDQLLLKQFQSTGERVFKLNPSTRPQRINKGIRNFENTIVEFNSTVLARGIGDMRREKWPATIIDKHPWVIKNSNLTWKFIEGFFEVNGGVYTYEGVKHKSQHLVVLSTSSASAAIFLSECLAKLGIQYPLSRSSSQTRERASGVAISNLVDLRLFSSSIYPKSEEKEEKLKIYRDKESQSGKVVTYSDEEVISEWNKLVKICGKPPTVTLIRELRRQGITRLSDKVYSLRFGNGSFIRARELLESSQDAASCLLQSTTAS